MWLGDIMTEPLCVILAAGDSKRMGEPKALIEVCERPLLALQIERLRNVGDFQIIVVTRKDLEDDVDQIIEVYADVDYCINEEPENGRTGSLQVAISSFDSVNRILVVPVDRPGWSEDTLLKLLKHEESCCPMKDNRGGHPVLIVGNDLDSIRNAKPDDSLRTIFKTHRVRVNDPYLHLNVDTKKDIEMLDEFGKTLDY